MTNIHHIKNITPGYLFHLPNTYEYFTVKNGYYLFKEPFNFKLIVCLSEVLKND